MGETLKDSCENIAETKISTADAKRMGAKALNISINSNGFFGFDMMPK